MPNTPRQPRVYANECMHSVSTVLIEGICLFFSMTCSSANYPARGRHLRVGYRADRRPCHHSPASTGGRGRSRVVLADGLQENSERQRPAAPSDPSTKPDVYESRPDVRTVTGLFDMIYKIIFIILLVFCNFFLTTTRLGARVVRL